MARTLKNKQQKKPTNAPGESLRFELMGILLIALGVFSVISLYFAPPNSVTPSTTGIFGRALADSLTLLAGSGRYILALFLGVWGLSMILHRRWTFLNQKMLCFLVLFLCFLTWLHLRLPVNTDYWVQGLQGKAGGIIGALFAWGLTSIFGLVGSYMVLGVVVVMTGLFLSDKSILEMSKQIKVQAINLTQKISASLEEFLFVPEEDSAEEAAQRSKRKDKRKGTDFTGSGEKSTGLDLEEAESVKGNKRSKIEKSELDMQDFEAFNLLVEPETASGKSSGFKKANPEKPEAENHFTDEAPKITFPQAEDVQLPPLSMLDHITTNHSPQRKELEDNTRLLESTLENFGIEARVVDVRRGPAITRYEIHLAPGIKVSKITGLADDIALNLAAQQVRIEAPIPGKSAIGIEVPNKEISLVHLREVLESNDYQQDYSRLAVAFGKDIAGHVVVGDLTKMPHLLIAGATGMGKSVCLNTLIASILFKSNPQEVKFLMIDPKMVELTTYNGIPHLISPVVTNPKKAAISLRWAVNQMEQRYEKFAELGVKDIRRYNAAKVKANQPEDLLPYIVIIIDELADLMMIAPTDVEDAVCRLAQMARAAGMHLVVATQRPSVDVITGLIKANIPSRVAFAVSSQTDSRTILDVGGAEKLVGSGDMLYMPVGYAKPLRVQGAFISDGEVDKLVGFLKEQEKPQFIEGITEEETKPVEEVVEEDELFSDAVRLFIENGQASISLLQRRFRIGYTRAARLIDLMEKKGVIGAFEGSKPREVLMTIEQYENQFGSF